MEKPFVLKPSWLVSDSIISFIVSAVVVVPSVKYMKIKLNKFGFEKVFQLQFFLILLFY